jgi:hypothetical protein
VCGTGNDKLRFLGEKKGLEEYLVSTRRKEKRG